MRKNVASQNVAAQMNSRSDGSPLTTAVSVLVTIDNGTQTTGSGTLAHKGNGHWNYVPTQAETNGNHVAFTFTHATGVNQTVNAYPVAFDPSDAVRMGLTALPNAAVGGAGGLPIVGTGANNFKSDGSANVTFANTSIATVTTLTNLPAITANWLTAAGIAAGALDNKGNWNIGKTGYSLSQAFPTNFASMSISAGGLVDITQAAADKAWLTTSRVLTAGTNIALAKGTGVTGFNDITVNAIWSEPVPGSFTTGQAGNHLGNLVNAVTGSAAINVRAGSYTLTTGIETNTYLATHQLDATLHRLDDVANVIDGFYEFDIGFSSVPISVTAHANVQSANDTITVSAWNWTTSAWEIVGSIPGSGVTTIVAYTFPLFVANVGVGANVGKVRVRFAILTGGSNPSLEIDLLYATYTITNQQFMFQGQAAAGGASSLTFPGTASAIDDFYKPGLLVLTSGTGAGQASRITDYNGTTKVATVATPWRTNPDSTTVFQVLAWASVRVSEVDTGFFMPSDVQLISGSAEAADNLEESLETMVNGTVSAGAHTTALIAASSVTGFGDATFKGRTLIFKTGTLAKEQGEILTYTSSTGAFTFAASTWTVAPSDTDQFIIV